jgi:hypothetical protein
MKKDTDHAAIFYLSQIIIEGVMNYHSTCSDVLCMSQVCLSQGDFVIDERNTRNDVVLMKDYP